MLSQTSVVKPDPPTCARNLVEVAFYLQRELESGTCAIFEAYDTPNWAASNADTEGSGEGSLRRNDQLCVYGRLLSAKPHF